MERRLEEQRLMYEALEKKKQSQVVSRGLPRPLQINQKYLKAVIPGIKQDERYEAERLI